MFAEVVIDCKIYCIFMKGNLLQLSRYVLLILLLFFVQSTNYCRDVEFVPHVETVFPVFSGGGVSAVIKDNFEIGLSFGVTPSPYYETIGNVAASYANDDNYKEVINAAFQNNSITRGEFQYNFNNARSGWSIGFSFSKLKSSGLAGIDTVLEIATGEDFTILKNILVALGKDLYVNISSEILLAEIYGGRRWNLIDNLTLDLYLGVIKVTDVDVTLTTGLPAFESTIFGGSLMSTAKSDIEQIVLDNGISPTVSLGISYVF